MELLMLRFWIWWGRWPGWRSLLICFIFNLKISFNIYNRYFVTKLIKQVSRIWWKTATIILPRHYLRWSRGTQHWAASIQIIDLLMSCTSHLLRHLWPQMSTSSTRGSKWQGRATSLQINLHLKPWWPKPPPASQSPCMTPRPLRTRATGQHPLSSRSSFTTRWWARSRRTIRQMMKSMRMRTMTQIMGIRTHF